MHVDVATKQSLRIAGLYGFVAGLWILFSDQIVGLYVSDPAVFTTVAMIKGWFFVAVTAAMLFALIRRQLRIVGDTSRAREAAEAAVRRSEERLRALTDLSPDIISIFDAEGRLVFNSSAATRIHGYSATDMLGKNTLDFVHPDDRAAVEAAFGQILLGSEAPVVVRYRYRNAAGSYAWMEASGRNELSNPHIRGLIAISRDITQRVRDEQERRQMQDQLIQSQKMEAVGQLAGGIAHDFNNILTVLCMSLDSLRGEPLPEPVREVCGDMEDACDRASSLTRQLLLFARRQVVQKHALDVDVLLKRLLNMLRRLIGEHILVELHPAPEAAWVIADTGMLEQVIMNLVVNARDAMPAGGRLSLRTRVVHFDQAAVRKGDGHPRRSGDFVCIAVEDTGCGIDEASLQRIFEPFFTTKEQGKGTGLGLATVFGIVQQHEGWIEVESSVGRGSVFSVFLPWTVPVASEESRSAVIPGDGSESILLAEDDARIRQLCVSTLTRNGYRVVEAAHGKAAREFWTVQGGNFDLLLTDMIMPEGFSGLDLVEALRLDRPELKAVLMSGYSLELSQHRGLEASGITYLAKPFNAEALLRTVRSVLGPRPVKA